MKKLLFVLTVLGLVMGAIVLPATAAPVSDLTALAQYFPEDAPLFLSIRTDDAYLQELDALIALVAAKLPAWTVPPVSLSALLNQSIMEATGQDFATSIRSWLGGTAAMGVPSVDTISNSSSEFVIAATITDRSAADAFWLGILTENGADFESTSSDAYTFYAMDSTANGQDGGLLIANDVLLLGVGDLEAMYVNASDANLSQNAAFTQAIGLLPAQDYNAMIYVDTAAVLLASADEGDTGEMSPEQVAALAGSTAIGLTVLDDRSLIMDVTSTGDSSELEAMGLAMGQTTVDLNFAANLPAGSSLVVHAADLKSIYESFLHIARLNETTPGEVDEQIEQFSTVVQSFMQLDLNEDIIDWMTGDFAVFVDIDGETIVDLMGQSLSGQMSGDGFALDTLPIEMGFVLAATDAAKAQTLAATIGRILPGLAAQNEDITISQEQIGDVDVTVIRQDLPMDGSSTVPLEIVIGANDEVFVFATYKAAAAILLSGEAGLDTAPSFAEASQYMLSNPTSVWYLNGEGFGSINSFFFGAMVGPAIGQIEDIAIDLAQGSDIVSPTPDPAVLVQQEQQIQDSLVSLFNMVSSGSISTEFTEGGSRTRLVLTISE